MALCHRLFFALLPSMLVLPSIGHHRDRLSELASKIANRRLHLTLAITDDFDRYSAALARQLCALADEIMAEPVAVALSRLTGSPESIALAVGRKSPALQGLQSALQERMVRAGLLRERWRFNPHVT